MLPMNLSLGFNAGGGVGGVGLIGVKEVYAEFSMCLA